MKVVLFAPDIPQNVGNIARTCAATGTKLVLVRPLSFSVSNKQLKRAGLDYWNAVKIEIVDALQDAIYEEPIYFFSTKGCKNYADASYEKNSTFIFGSESAGLPNWVHEQWASHFLTIPMREGMRSLNLANSVAIVLYEALRQHQFSLFHNG
jgi:tRNA (cytidine/uridine-2'-O-)-methyltransferase